VLALSGDKPVDKEQKDLHHIVAKKAARAAAARLVLKAVDIGINSAENTMEVIRALHQRLHTDAYYKYVNATVDTAYGGGKGNARTRVVGALNTIRSRIRNMEGAL